MPLPRPRIRAGRRFGTGAVAVVLTGLALLISSCSSTPTPGPQASDDAVQSIDLGEGWGWQPQANRLELGVTHTQDSLDPEEPADARARGEEILSTSAVWQNQHLMGFGTLNPEPSPGDYQWGSLDKRMQLIRATGGRTVLTLCCAPDWMKGGQPGQTNWSRLEEAPDPAFFDAYAELSAQAVQRYPQIERVLVWNELKGFYNTAENRWDYEGYTALYNKVYAAVKAVRPDVQVGGPYAVLNTLEPGAHDPAGLSGPWGAVDQRALDIVDYWLVHKVGADFIALDGSTGTRNGDTAPVDVGAQKFADLAAWVAQRTPLPIWWAEFYADVPPGAEGGPDSDASAVASLAAVGAFARSGASVALLWGPQGGNLAYSALWTDSTEPDGGRPTPLTAAWQWLVPRLAAGNVEVGRSTTRPLLAFRAPDGAVVVNLTGDPVETTAGHDPLPGWAVVIHDPPQTRGD